MRAAGFVNIVFGIALIILGYAGLKTVARVMDAGIGSGTREMTLVSELRRDISQDNRQNHIEQYIELHRSALDRLGDIKSSMIGWSLAVGAVGCAQAILGLFLLYLARRSKLGPNISLKRTNQSLRD